MLSPILGRKKIHLWRMAIKIFNLSEYPCGSVCGSVGSIQVSSVWHYPSHSITLSRVCTSSHMPFFDALKSTVPEERQLVDNVYETTLSDKFETTMQRARRCRSYPRRAHLFPSSNQVPRWDSTPVVCSISPQINGVNSAQTSICGKSS